MVLFLLAETDRFRKRGTDRASVQCQVICTLN